ncbi:carbohydrate ABC transporter permease [Kibdelosporangium aridum]|uniref:N,N'-diacetylchitobiose transport system permease protein n=1 Tax=Kibdelosporangium aridum TaxID=2030 RepID=A0A1W2EXA2_KIBAR|nr:sugar ABC transporter permease [Kibdelosporangium aridum]SMD13838.1 N,N'-diacetylchitobiose transport system permease protein [Kibdelosporangium aridum]
MTVLRSRPALEVPPVPRARATRITIWPYLLVAPTIVAAAYLLIYPLLRNVVISMQRFGIGELIRGDADLVWFANYVEILTDPQFWAVVRRTVAFTVVNVGPIMVLSTAVALLLTGLGRWMRLLVMGGLVLTWAMPIIAATTVFQWLFASQLGLVNWVLVSLGFEQFDGYTWFASGSATFGILVALIVWQSVPFAALVLYSAMTTVPAELYESARIDGASGTRMFRSITFPILRPMFGLVLCLEVIWVVKAFVQIWAISQGGPGQATTTLPVYAFQVAQALHKFDLGAAISMVTVLMLTVVLLVYIRTEKAR